MAMKPADINIDEYKSGDVVNITGNAIHNAFTAASSTALYISIVLPKKIPSNITPTITFSDIYHYTGVQSTPVSTISYSSVNLNNMEKTGNVLVLAFKKKDNSTFVAPFSSCPCGVTITGLRIEF